MRSRCKRRAVLLAVVIGLFIISSGMTTASAYSGTTTDTSPVFDVTITEAKYCDLDGDIEENDVLVVLKFDMGYASYYDFDYYIRLTLPSGESYIYYVWIIAWAETIYVNNVFYNHATESGDYTVDVDALMYHPGSIWDYESHVFDPPGGSPGGPPTFDVY